MKHTPLLLALLLGGCSAASSPIAQPAAPTAFGEKAAAALSTAITARAGAEVAQQGSAGKLRANIDAAALALADGASESAAGELTVAQGRLALVTPDPVEAAAATERRTILAAGKEQEAKDAYAGAARQGTADATHNQELEAEANRLRLQADALAGELIATAERNRISNQKAIDEATARANNQVLAGQVAKLNWAGAACMAVALGSLGLGLAIGGAAALSRVGPLALVSGLGALICFGAAQIVGAWWFVWAIGAAILVSVTWFAVWFYRHQKAGDVAAELAARSAKIATIAQKAVPVLDAAYDTAEAPVRAWLDEHIFTPLSGVMDDPTKATVHEIRADAKRAG